jgi:hypothetical protein
VTRGKALVALAALLCVLVPASPALAADIGPDDEVVVTGRVTIPEGRHVDRVWIGDGRVDIAGHCEGDVIALDAPVHVSGVVDGNVIALAKRITLAPSAEINGDIVYVDKRPVIPDGATVHGEVRDLDATDLSIPFGAFLLLQLAIWVAVTLSSLALGLALLWLAPRAADAAFAVAGSAPSQAIGWGAALFFGLPLAAVVALATLVGIPFGLTVLLALLPLWAIGYVTSAWLLGRALVNGPRSRAVVFLAGWGIMRAIALVPLLGAVAGFGATVFGLGVLTLLLRQARSPERALASDA